MPKEGEVIKTKYIDPDPRLIKYVREKPLAKRKVEELNWQKRKLNSKRLLSSKEEKELEGIESNLTKLKSEMGTFSDNKVKILDEIIFPSMANLTFFL
jgi:hypothetical protein